MMFPRKDGFDDEPPVAQSLTQYSSGFTYIYVYTSETPHKTQTDYTGTETQFLKSLPTSPNPVGQSAPSITPPPIYRSDSLNHDPEDGPPGTMSEGVKAVTIIMALVGVAAIVLASAWFCCGCCGFKAKRARRRAARQQETNVLPLHTISNQPQEQSREPSQHVAQPAGDLPPPSYEEVVPAQHQRLAGGLPNINDEENGMVVDGKTPLSEIPFEDVVLDHSPTGSSSSASSASQAFSARHHNQNGDTRGHTNS